MKSDEYIARVLMTESTDWDAIRKRLSGADMLRMLHAFIGIATEAGELLDALKKHIFYGKGLDIVNVEEELGDLDWYQSIAIHALRLNRYNTSWEQIWEKNIAKLQARYPDKFTSESAVNRDLAAERAILEGSPAPKGEEEEEEEEIEECNICGFRPERGNVVYEDDGRRPLCPRCNK